MKKVGKKAYSQKLSSIPDLLSLAKSYPKRFPALLSSEAKNDQTGRYSLLFCTNKKPKIAKSKQKVVELLNKVHLKQQSNKKYKLPFYSGWFVYLSYESIKSWEKHLSHIKQDNDQPLMIAIKCNSGIVIDHKKQKSWAVGKSKKHISKILKYINQIQIKTEECNQFKDLLNDDESDYIKAVKQVQKLIKDGDVYQVNLARKWKMKLDKDPCIFALYKILSKNNPSPFAGFLRTSSFSIVSSSPERLVKVENNRIESRPIAGTRPRGKSKLEDEKLAQELSCHPKERAEHVMLVDLVRNDIGRVSKVGTVSVDEFMIIESYAKVHHIVSNVIGELDSQSNFSEIIKSLFPGGTITGCPKIRCMQVIDELEKHPRGAYTGSMGYVSDQGKMDLNILIRTISINDNQLEIKAGAGIVIDSIPQNESMESLFKAQALINSVKP